MKICLKKFGKNDVGIYYTREELQAAVDEYQNNNFGVLYGIFGGMDYQTTVELDKIAFKVTNLVMEDDGLYGEVTILDTPKGQLLRECVDHVKFGLNGTGVVQHDGRVLGYRIICASALLTNAE